MKKFIYSRIILVTLPCVILLSILLIYLLYNRAVENELTSYLAVAISVTLAIILVILIALNNVAQRLTKKIVSSLEKIDFNNDFSIDGIADYDELMQYSVNIEQQKQALVKRIEELSDRTDTIETITGNMQEGMILTKSDGTILSANNSVYKIFGENIEKKNVLHICRDVDFQSAVKQCFAGENAEIQMERNSRIFTVFFSPVFSGENGNGDLNGKSHGTMNKSEKITNGTTNSKTRGAVILFHDTTERHIAEKQRREFSANVSHELKTPLTTITALSEMIAQGIAKEEDIKCFAGRITEQSGRLLLLIDDIIRLSEFDEEHTDKEITSFDLWELAGTVINTLRDNAGSIELILTGDRFDISANHRMIDELLYNLIDNGIKYNKENGTVTINLTQEENGMCKISVSDTGIGISEEHHPHVFERFYRAEKSRSKKTGGTGLGLSIVKHITESYNGRLELESTVGVGTTVSCWLMV